MPTTSDHSQAQQCYEKIMNLFNGVISTHTRLGQEDYRRQTDNSLESKLIKDQSTKLEKLVVEFREFYEKYPHVLQKLEIEFDKFLNKITIHFPLFIQDIVR